MNIKIAAMALVSLIVCSCDTSNKLNDYGTGGYEVCSAEYLRWTAFQFAKDHYYYADHLPLTVDIEQYSSTYSMIRDIRYEPIDHFSFSVTGDEYNSAFISGNYDGFGFSWQYDSSEHALMITQIHDGPARQVGMNRGDKILSINGYTAADVSNMYDNNQSSLVWQHPEGKTGSDFVWQPASGETQKTQYIESGTISVRTVQAYQVFDNADSHIGYLSYQRFGQYGEQDLDDAVSYFKQQNVDELIVDLRLNPGGAVYLAQKLASSILPQTDIGLDLIHIDYLDKPHVVEFDYMKDSWLKVVQTPSHLALSRLYVLTSEQSCSASELLINSLKPYIDVIQIGSTTCGKPMGMNPVSYCSSGENGGEVFSIVNFESINANGEGHYYDGIAPQCTVTENGILPWGDAGDSLTAAALNHIHNGSCDSVVAVNAAIRLSTPDKKIISRPNVNYQAEYKLVNHF
ncbi:MAG: S41 family peptidase [Reinekea sp.]|jgi:carboxyl-terminal processing protease